MVRRRREKWYSAEGQSRSRSTANEQSKGLRRLLSLLVLLALVIVLIQQTSDAKKVGRVASAIGLLPSPGDLDTTVAGKSLVGPASPAALQFSAPTTIEPAIVEAIALASTDAIVQAERPIWRELLRRAPERVSDALVRRVIGQSPSRPDAASNLDTWKAVLEWYTKSGLQLSQWSMLDSEKVDSVSPLPRFIDSFRELSDWFHETDLPPLSERSKQSFRSLRMAIDDHLQSLVVDDAPWKSTERLSILRAWQRVDALRGLLSRGDASPADFGRVETTQLLADSAVYRGYPVRFSGTIALLQKPESISETGFEPVHYEVLWLKPDDASNQPVCVYVPPASFDGNANRAVDGRVSVTGYFFKRFAYPSKRDGDIAPLLFAAYVAPDNAAYPPAKNRLFAELLRSSSDLRAWVPPVDTTSAIANIQSRLLPVLERLSSDRLNDGFSGTDATAASAPIWELTTLEPQIELLLEQKASWDLSEFSTVARVSGVVTQIERVRIDQKSVPLAEVPYVYRCRLQNTKLEGESFQVLCASIPMEWLQPDGNPIEGIRQPCAMSMIMLSADSKAQLGWARSIRWRVDDGIHALTSLERFPPLSESRTYLLEQGWDLSWIDLVRELQTEPIKTLSSRELKPYFALMKLAKQAPLVASDSQSMGRPLGELLVPLSDRAKAKPTVERVQMKMRVVRVTRVKVVDGREAKLLGSDHYYQMDTMADIGNRTFEIKTDGDPIVYNREYPVTCVAIDVPNWLLKSALGANEQNESEQVWYPRAKATGSGWFYRFWSYKTQEITQSLGKSKRQISPLVVLDALELGIAFDDEPTANIAIGRTANTVALVIGLVGTLFIWRTIRTHLTRKTRKVR